MTHDRLFAARAAAALVCTLAPCGCVNQLGPSSEETSDNRELFADETETSVNQDALTTAQPVGSTLRVTATALNLRSGPSTGYGVILVMPNDARVTLVTSAPTNGWYQIRYSSMTGWSSGQYLALVSTPPPSGSTSTGADRAIARAQSGVGFSYWWGHGRWRAEGPTSSTRGSCSGSCPSCSHSGSYGADCSGYVAKAWSVPGNNVELTSDAHPYSTYNFYNEQTHWSRVSRENIRRADALVYRSGGSGHIVLYESGSPWGQSWVYEARGCSSGIGRNLRSFSSSYRTIRRAGF
jgi:hypothetical protein